MGNPKQFDIIDNTLKYLFNENVLICRNYNKFCTQPHFHDYYEIEFIISGKAIHHVNNEIQVLSSGDIVFVRPEDRHFFVQYSTDYADFSNYNIRVNCTKMEKDFLTIEKFRNDIIAPSTPYIINLPSAEAASISNKIGKFFNRSKKHDEMMFLYDAVLRQIFSQLAVQNQTANSTILPNWFEYYLQYISKPEVFSQEYSEIVKSSNVSKNYLHKIFKKYLDITISEYINNLMSTE